MNYPQQSLTMDLVHAVVKHHGGTISIDEQAETFTVLIPENAKESCFGDIAQVIGPVELLDEKTFPIP